MSSGRWNKKQGDEVSRLVELTYGRVCWLCHTPIMGRVSPDHVIPVSLGGNDSIENLRPSHVSCNKRRQAKPAAAPLLTTTAW